RLLLRKGPSLEAIQPPSRLQGRLVAGRKQGDDQAKRPPRRIRVDILRHVPAPVGLASLGDERGEPFAVAPRPCCAVSGVSVLRRADRLGRRTALVPARDSLSPRGIEAFPRRAGARRGGTGALPPRRSRRHGYLLMREIGRASCRERVYVMVVGGCLNKKMT